MFTFLQPTLFFHFFLCFLSPLYHLKYIIIYFDSGKAEKSLKQQNKSGFSMWKAQIL